MSGASLTRVVLLLHQLAQRALQLGVEVAKGIHLRPDGGAEAGTSVARKRVQQEQGHASVPCRLAAASKRCTQGSCMAAVLPKSSHSSSCSSTHGSCSSGRTAQLQVAGQQASGASHRILPPAASGCPPQT